MKNIIYFLLCFHFANAKSYDYKKIMNQYSYMSAPQAIKKWSITNLQLKQISKSDFKKLTSNVEKTQYLIYLAQNNKFIGVNRNLVVDVLGEPDSYFFSELNATYELLKIDENQWVVSFEVSSDLIVRSIKIAKKCCYGGK